MQALAKVKQLIKSNGQTNNRKIKTTSDLCPLSSVSSVPLHGSELVFLVCFFFLAVFGNYSSPVVTSADGALGLYGRDTSPRGVGDRRESGQKRSFSVLQKRRMDSNRLMQPPSTTGTTTGSGDEVILTRAPFLHISRIFSG